jgi:hypothetical protein
MTLCDFRIKFLLDCKDKLFFLQKTNKGCGVVPYESKNFQKEAEISSN